MTREPRIVAPGVPELFLNDNDLLESQNVQRTWHALNKHPANPVLSPVDPETGILLFGTVLVDPDTGRFRMWYYVYNTGVAWIGYAESDDGLAWSRPNLGLLGIAPNAVFMPESHRLIGFAGVIDDQRAPPAERYKLMVSTHDASSEAKTYLLAVSPDGLTWDISGTFTPDDPAYPDTCCFTQNPADGTYHLYTRCRYAPEDVIAQDSPNFFGRAVSLCTSTDFRNWSAPEHIMNVTTDDPFGSEIYSLMAYPVGSEWVGLHQMHTSLPAVGMIDMSISHSPDGHTWTRETESVLPNGCIGEWDRFNQSVATAIVDVGDETWVYYSGRMYRHGEYRCGGYPDTGPQVSHIGVATLRRHGWCSLDAAFDGGTITTQPMSLPSESLTINAACRFGEIVVELIDPSGTNEPIMSLPICGNGVALPVQWESGDAVPVSGDREMQVRFHLTNARLYSWQIG
jgi:predicted GH43/DUF377 family glycosyl hydrolase